MVLKILSITTVFNVDDSKSAYHKDYVTLKIGVMILKIPLCHHKNIFIFKIYSNRKPLIKIFLIKLLHF